MTAGNTALMTLVEVAAQTSEEKFRAAYAEKGGLLDAKDTELLFREKVAEQLKELQVFSPFRATTEIEWFQIGNATLCIAAFFKTRDLDGLPIVFVAAVPLVPERIVEC